MPGCLGCTYYTFVALSRCCSRLGMARRIDYPLDECRGFFDLSEKKAIPMPKLKLTELKAYADRDMPIQNQFAISPDGESITCLACGMTSYNKGDIHYRYCGKCKKFHHGEPLRIG